MAKSTTKGEFDTTEEEVVDAGAMFENNEDGLVVDLSNVEAQKFEVLPKGNYNVIIEDCEYQISKSSNKPMWNLKLAVTDEEFTNRKLFTFLSFSEKALPGTKANLAVIAPALVEGPFNPKSEEAIAQIIGVACKVKVKVEKYNDEDKNTVQKFMPGDNSDGFIG